MNKKGSGCGQAAGTKAPLISKSRYMAGLQCPKLLWYHFNQPDAFLPTDAATQALFDQGSRVAYNASFEKNALRACSEAYPAFATWWTKTEPRVVDLLQPFRNFHYYHPDQDGSASMKAVLPALTGSGYEDMEIADGATASQEFARVTFGKVPAAERQRVRAALEKYCGLDTEGMVRIVEKLTKLVAL